MNTSNRRDFLKNSAVFAVMALLGAKLLTWGQAVFAEALALVDMTKTKRKDADNEAAVGILSGMGYVDNADKAEKEKKITRTDKPMPSGGVFPAKKQYCTNCVFMDEAELNTGKPGKCKLVPPPVLVNGKGYCNTYNVSPKAKV